MKTRYPILSVVLLFLAATSLSQNRVLPDKNLLVVKTDLLFFVPDFYKNTWSGKLSVEKGFSQRHSFQFSTGFILETDPKVFDLMLIPEYKFYFKDQGFKGFYTGIYLKDYFSKQKISTGYGNEYGFVKNNSRGAGLSFGYQCYTGTHFTLDFLIGGGFIYTVTTIERGTTAPGATIGVMNNSNGNHVKPDGRLSINIGYKF